MYRKLSGWFVNLPIKARLAVLFAVTSIIPVLVTGFMSLKISSDNMLEKGIQDSLNRLEFIEYRMVELVRKKHEDTLMTAFNPAVRSYFDPQAVRTGDTLMPLEDQVRRQIMGLFNKQETTSVMFVGRSGEALVYGAVQSSPVAKVEAPDRANFSPADFKLFDRWADAAWEWGEPVIPYERLVLAQSDSAPVALMIVNVKEALLNQLYSGYEDAHRSRFFIVNERGTVQSCTDKRHYAQAIEDVLGIDVSMMDRDAGHLDRDGNIISYVRNANRGFYFLECTPEWVFGQGFWPIVQLTGLVALISIGACVFLGSRMSLSFTRPLYRLIERLSAFASIGGAGAARTMTKNEIAILNDQYDRILERLESVIGEYYEEQKKKKEAQIRALEFQINPHFLYNTLSTIIWLIDAGDGKAAIRITKDLSQFFRISISKGHEFIPIREELKHVDLYIEIQKARYRDSIFLTYRLDEALLALFTPKLILQPLVENSIIHAMQVSAAKTCEITIAVARDGDDVVFEVRDNGANATRESLDAMNRFLWRRDAAPADNGYGIGISNVHDRVQMGFGAAYGLMYRREGDETVATVRIKALYGGEPVV